MDVQPQKKSYKLIWIAGTSLVVLVLIVGVTIALVAQNQPKKAATTKTTPVAKVATKEQVKDDIAKLQENLKKSADYTAAAKAAIAATPKKVGK